MSTAKDLSLYGLFPLNLINKYSDKSKADKSKAGPHEEENFYL